jgi:hypothetical protein
MTGVYAGSEGEAMRRLILVIALMLLPVPVLAQSAPSSDGDLQQRIRQKKIIVQPKPSPETATREANEAVDELGARARRDETLRDLNRPMPPRPDLNENVTGGIQTRNLNSIRPR